MPNRAPAVIKIELLVLLDDSFWIERRSEIEPTLWYAAYDPRFRSQRHIFENALLCRNGGNAFRHSDAEIHDAPERQLEGAAASDNLALIKLHRLDAIEGHALPAGIRVIVMCAIRLKMIIRFGEDHAVDQNAGYLDVARVERIRGRDSLDLRDHEATRIFRGHGRIKVVQRKRLALHGDIAVRIAGGPPDQCDVDGERLIAQPFLTIDLHNPNELLGRHAVDLAALVARIDESTQSNLRNRARAARGDLTIEMRDATQWQVVGFDLVVQGQFAELGYQAPVAADHALEQAFMGKSI